ncbi:MAG: LLM class F420-dependent oxidoreductase [Dehalococcoidia bacterium]
MELGLQISNFTWKGRGPKLGETLADIARTAEDVGFSSLWVMDHLFQIPPIGSARMEMLEPYTALAFIAAQTKTATVGTMVTGVTYRNPGYLCKQVSTLDVLSGGRAVLGLGAAWFDREHRAYGIPFPPLKERFERLEETILVLKQLWSREDGRFEGRHYTFKETLNSPQPLQKPHPPLLIGGRGEKKTIKLAAKYANAYNIHTDDPEVASHKFAVLRAHCEAAGRDYNEIKRTVLMAMDPGEAGERSGELVEQLGRMAEAGAQAAYGYLPHVDRLEPLEVAGRDVLPRARAL